MKKEEGEEAEKEGGRRKKKRKRKEEKNPHPWRAIRRKIERVFNFTYHSLSIVTSILDYGSIEFVGEKYCSVGTYLPIRNTISRNLLEIYSRNDHSPKLSPRERIENGKALVRFGRVRWAKRGNCHRGLRENRGLPTLVEYTRVSKRSGSSLTKEVGRDARRTARDRWWGKESLQLVPSFVAR